MVCVWIKQCKKHIKLKCSNEYGGFEGLGFRGRLVLKKCVDNAGIET